MTLPRILAAALVLPLLLSSCQTTPEQDPQAAAGQVRQTVTIDDQDAPAHLDVASGKITPAAGKAPKAAYIDGVVSAEGRFQPTSHVLGEYTCLCGMEKYMHQLTTGWLDLRTGKFVKKTRENDPAPPYLLGQIDETGEFHPDSRVVFF
jgi:hypothetical protein